MKRFHAHPCPLARFVLFALFAFAAGPAGWAAASDAIYDGGSAPVRFAAAELANALEEAGMADVAPRFRLGIAGEGAAERFRPDDGPLAPLEPQGFAIVRGDNGAVWAVGADEAGAMYGGLHLAEQIRIGREPGEIRELTRNPSIAKRGLKFNIPLDARTPSYDDTGGSARANYAEMWNFEFWREFIDDMARHHYNTLTLWNPHPFPSIVRVPEYPEMALEDVCETTLEPVHEHGVWRDPQFVSPKVLENLKVVKRMTMDGKIDYWRRVLQHARDRCVDVYWITWNVIMNSAEGKRGVTTDQDNPLTIAYLRASVRETLLTYPQLTGIGVTAGENMRNRDDEYGRENWLWMTYGMGIMDAKEQQPGREVRFIHRVWNTGLESIMRDFAGRYPDPFEIGFKYARAHLYSSTQPVFADALLEEMENYDVKCWWNLRNDDIFNFRWGDPNYVKDFLANLPEGKTAGYHMGSDGYVWGREFTGREPQSPRQLEIRKHWFSFMLWGRLGYQLDMPRSHIVDILQAKFPGADASALLNAWSAASNIIPLVNRFHWRDWDFMWAPEGCFDQRNGFHTVRDFIENPVMEGSGIQTIPEYVEAQREGEPIEGIAPPEVVRRLEEYANRALRRVSGVRLNADAMSAELRQTLDDIEAMAWLGRYYASKTAGALELHWLDETGGEAHRGAAVSHLRDAEAHWKKYAATASRNYRPQLLARTRTLDWNALLDDVRKDIEIALNE